MAEEGREREGTWIRKKAGRSGWSTSGPDGIFRWLKLEQGVPARTLCEANIDVGKGGLVVNAGEES